MPAPRDARALKSRPGLARVRGALKYSLQGLRAAWQKEAAFRQEGCLAVFMLAGQCLLPLPLLWHVLLVSAVFLVLVAELLNSGIEAAIDRIGPEIHPLSKYAKDVGSAAVFLALVHCGIVWALGLWAAFG